MGQSWHSVFAIIVWLGWSCCFCRCLNWCNQRGVCTSPQEGRYIAMPCYHAILWYDAIMLYCDIMLWWYTVMWWYTVIWWCDVNDDNHSTCSYFQHLIPAILVVGTDRRDEHIRYDNWSDIPLLSMLQAGLVYAIWASLERIVVNVSSSRSLSSTLSLWPL